ncbi:MAG: Methyltransferase type 11 [Parcubacteria group bacterium GW2011_GWC2_39_14]|nr:MAG: Methyltransferase type 11 [Parcubacteria group bacterium GW2011_GWC2_39_14]KKR54545.1 MAG: Methyltransferase type 11 [Parcubacteria group bacterium GW2011_GWA2_40_23]
MKHGFDIRIVSYEHIHSIHKKDWNKLLKAINPQPNEIILDGMCGYGAVGKRILEKENSAKLFLLDESKVQMKRAEANLPEVPKKNFTISSLPKSNFKKEFFDKIVIKMGLHEVPKKEQVNIAKEVSRILKPKGKFIVWDIMLNNKTQSLFQDIIRKKDELSEFDMLTKERYFFKEDEFLKTMREATFSKITEFHTINYKFSSRKRLESELHNDKKKLNLLNEFIRKRFPKELKQPLDFKDNGDDIQFMITKKIYIMTK